jgi:RimJ/RimL family protein N-acetyltransferase
MIRPLSEADVAGFVGYRGDPDVARWQSWDADYTDADARRLVADQHGWTQPPPGEWMQLAMIESATDRLVGDLALHLFAEQPDTWEIGFTVSSAYQRRGFATEGARALLDALFAGFGAHRVVASCDARNAGSVGVLKRLGMRHEASELESDWFKGEWTSVERYAVLQREWR